MLINLNKFTSLFKKGILQQVLPKLSVGVEGKNKGGKENIINISVFPCPPHPVFKQATCGLYTVDLHQVVKTNPKLWFWQDVFTVSTWLHDL